MSVYRLARRTTSRGKLGSGTKPKWPTGHQEGIGGGTTEINEGSCKGHGDLAHNDCEVGQKLGGKSL
ncbi:Uncharacterized protein FKW44_014660 [Caligus rogercresseyi]|uniref:Uncharacterized protein n=1 Tax=Caligus rogercresseyi TaxID=217165 RepID=A0A7T8K022_CALRO|nr:Uncharacterized protein FKW44_014660 [Caligus rogercresseyi]